MHEETWLAEPALFHCGWSELIDAADAAGRWAARQFAVRNSAAQLAEPGHTWVHVSPLASPVASWLYRHGDASVSEERDGVLIPITVTADDLCPATAADDKACSLLVARAYATAYCSVLAEEAGVAAVPVIAETSATVSAATPPPQTGDPLSREPAEATVEPASTP